jgi:hypothetical protein
MTIEFTTTITGMEAYPIKDSVPLYVFRVYWNYLGDDSVYSTAMQGSTDVPTSDPQSAIPYADLTEEQVMGWVQEYTPSWMFEEYTDKITAWITAQYTPEIVNPPLPWTEVPVVEPVEMPVIEPVVELVDNLATVDA